MLSKTVMVSDVLYPVLNTVKCRLAHTTVPRGTQQQELHHTVRNVTLCTTVVRTVHTIHTVHSVSGGLQC
jgi:hypothetical protein